MLTYSPGTWYAVVSVDTVALLSAEVGESTLRAVWTGMHGGDGFAAVLEGLVGGFGASLSALPPFAVASRDPGSGGIRVIARGAVTVWVDGPGLDGVQVSGLGATTWADRTFGELARVRIAPSAGAQSTLPLGDGVVLAGAVDWQPTPRASTESPRPEHEDDSITGPAATSPAAPEPTSGETLAFTSSTVAADETHGYDEFLFGATRMSTVEDAAVRVAESDGLIDAIPAPPSPPAPVPSPLAGDHDGETMSAEQFAALRARSDAAGGTASPVPMPAAATAPTSAPALVVSTGQRCVLDRSAVVGRKPRVLHATGTVPNLITVPSPQQDISRSHVELRVDGTDVLAVDLDTMNGTKLLRTGQEPVRLHPNQATLLVHGDRLDLGDGVVLSFEGL